MSNCCCNHAESAAFVQPFDNAVVETMPCVCGATPYEPPKHVDCVTKHASADGYRHHPARFALPWDFVEAWRCVL